jgi:hypothetical protein
MDWSSGIAAADVVTIAADLVVVAYAGFSSLRDL